MARRKKPTVFRSASGNDVPMADSATLDEVQQMSPDQLDAFITGAEAAIAAPTAGRASPAATPGRSPAFSGNELRARLRQYDRSPFIELLAGWMECAPDSEAIASFAKRSPDRYVAALAAMARMAGFADKTESTADINLNLNVSRMSDSQVEDRLAELAARLGMPDPRIVDATFETVDAAPSSDKPDNT